MSLSDVVSELSPRMRGKLLSPTSIVRTSRNYPRVCGENLAVHPAHKPYPGTIPAYAGKTFADPDQLIDERGTIPAYAGKTGLLPFSVFVLENYPRVCGENRTLASFDSYFKELSPRMRGKPQNFCYLPLINRTIPAYAGKTTALA